MPLPFVKYQGAGNDFIIFNHVDEPVLTDLSPENIARLCDRRFGIGADGLMLLEPHAQLDFNMRYYNADGHPSTMCGNGGRCLAAYAYRLGIIGKETTFLAVDGEHHATVNRPDWVHLSMRTVTEIETPPEGYFLQTGSPHYVQWVADPKEVNVAKEGPRLRYHARFQPGGTNVNFVTGDTNGLTIATYERGVEAETLACGTGVTAAAIVAVQRRGETGRFTVPVKAKGGNLAVIVEYDGTTFRPQLCGPATFVFAGEIEG